MIPLRGHALTHLVGGPVIASLTAVLLLSWRARIDLAGPLAAALRLLGAAASWRPAEERLSRRPSAVPA